MDDKAAAKAAAALTANFDRAGKLHVLFLGRTKRNKGGGVAQSCRNIAAALESVGDVCRVREVAEPLVDVPSDTNLIWQYGDSDRTQYLDQHLEVAREFGVPLVVNSSYDGTPDKRNWMRDEIVRLCGDRPGDMFFALFSHEALRDVRMSKLAPWLVALPKTISAIEPSQSAVLGFQQRAGICVGEVEKLVRKNLVRGIDVAEAVAALRRACPSAELWCYDQYAGGRAAPPAGAKIAARRQHGPFVSWLGTLRLFVSLVKHETFAMVPSEAQSVGTVVLFRSMPQSLSEYFGFTAAAFETPEELGAAAARLYHHRPSWEAFSSVGLQNAASRSGARVGAAISLALRDVIARYRRRPAAV